MIFIANNSEYESIEPNENGETKKEAPSGFDLSIKYFHIHEDYSFCYASCKILRPPIILICSSLDLSFICSKTFNGKFALHS